MEALAQTVSPGGGVWADVAGQPRIVAQLSRAARAARNLVSAQNHPDTSPTLESESSSDVVKRKQGKTNVEEDIPPSAMTHAWLIVGPPGSGRSVAAKAFAAALQCRNPQEPGCGTCQACQAVKKGIHPDVTTLATELMQITNAEVKTLVADAYRRPVEGQWRIIIVEDYDRITESSSNVLLKAIEEPPERTVWLLCAPSASDVLPTVRSRCRLVHLSLPTAQSVTELLVRRNHVDPLLAAQVGAESGWHFGRALALATDENLRKRRDNLLKMVASMRNSTDACWTASALVKLAKDEAEDMSADTERNARAALLKTYGLTEDTPDSELPRDIKPQMKRLEEDSRRRNRRVQFDAWDRILQDIAGLYRDALLHQLGAASEMINARLDNVVRSIIDQDRLHGKGDGSANVARLESIRLAREQLMRNGQQNLTLEALCINLLPR